VALSAFLNYIDVLDFPDEPSLHSARIRADLKKLGTMIGANDLFIAAPCSLELTLVTNNTESLVGTIGRAKPERVSIKRGESEVSVQFTVDANQHFDLGARGYVAPNASPWAGFDSEGRVIVIKEGLWSFEDHCYRLGR